MSERRLVLTRDLLHAGVQLADALVFLKSMGVLHRDLAARNVLVGAEHIGGLLHTVKLADFGLGRDVEGKEYYKQLSKVYE